ncbi:MAG: HD-GYP domain-containing protein [Lachnospiraceae bacterium]|nr:HD-GYP domain-containing protein [Lachnospiraceae bacterium]
MVFYNVCFLISLLLSLIYIFWWHRHYDVNITIIFLLIPLNNFFYASMFTNAELYLTAQKLIYFAGCMLPWFITMCVLNLCRIRVSRWVRTASFALNLLMFVGILSIGHYPFFYREITVVKTAEGLLVTKEYGPLHSLFYVMVGLYFGAGICVLLYCYIKKRQVSRRILQRLFVPQVFAIASYLLAHVPGIDVELVPLSYIIAQIMYLLIVHRMVLYDVSDMVIESMVETGDTAFLTLDFKHHYLGSNEKMRSIIPALNNLAIDQSINDEAELKANVIHWLGHFEEDESAVKNLFVIRDKEDDSRDQMFIVNVNYLYDGRRRRGYQIFLVDDTQNQRYIRLMDSYNSELEEQVAAKTDRIVKMHDNLIMSMATMVESRDNSTGGHIRRTSEGVRIMIDEIRKGNTFQLTEDFCRNIIKAAPMHDLGKIAVDDAVLRKPGRFTDEEFAIMKKHAAEGARIVHEILKGTDDEVFHKLAENVAHYHHERWDGSGYPDGLKGEQIPLEARIMAIADVYDALVSKRVYKESMSFEAADAIIMEGMGKHFDERLKPYYEAARPRLEEFYKNNSEQ